MFEVLKARLAELQTVGKRALPRAAQAVLKKLRDDVTRGRRAAQKRRKAERTDRKARGDRTPVKARRGSGVPIRVEVVGSAVIVSASSQVQKLARDQGETTEWMELFGDAIRAAARKGSR